MKVLNTVKKYLVFGVGCVALINVGLAATTLSKCNEAGLSEKQQSQIKLFVQQARALVLTKGIQNASKELMSPKFIHDDLYIFVIDHNQYSLANGGRADFVGKNLKSIKDARESAQKIIDSAKQGGGWVNYIWKSPKTHHLECKTSWVSPLLKDPKSELTYTIGAGIEH
ncbi:MAG: cache domain-containing protein [Legionellaceae bacterium]|nr:cache domain-containing protein [Legionellaceae bacterium]